MRCSLDGNLVKSFVNLVRAQYAHGSSPNGGDTSRIAMSPISSPNAIPDQTWSIKMCFKFNWVTGSPPKCYTLLASWNPTYMQSFIISHSSCAEQYGDMSSDTRTHARAHTQGHCSFIIVEIFIQDNIYIIYSVYYIIYCIQVFTFCGVTTSAAGSLVLGF